MGIYIKNMKEPVTCCHCPLMGYDPDIEWADGGRETQGAYICVITHELVDNTKREEHCPLIELPPHGRLIDADSKTFPTLHRNPSNDYMKGWNACLRSVQQHPTVIPAEEEST